MTETVDSNSRKLVSVIVLNYNGATIIGRCLEHLMRQSYPNFEVLVIDNGSSDASAEIIERYLPSGKVSLIHSGRNLGCAGGRNLGLMHARGEVLAFIDNDGYADPRWLEEAVDKLESDPAIGAVAPLVFFADRKIILNGAGGTINLHGYGGDHCYGVPYEFAQLPQRVLYPMGCGMVIRAELLKRLGEWDELLFNYFDDTELGIRIWKAGYRIEVAPLSWVDHQHGFSDRQLGTRTALCERNRIRTAIKYFPFLRLLSWLAHEWHAPMYRNRSVPWLALRSWWWNLRHLPSALYYRLRFARLGGSFWPLLEQSWGDFPPAMPANQTFRPDPAAAGAAVAMDGARDGAALSFGWYYPEASDGYRYRWSDARASMLFRFDHEIRQCRLHHRFAQSSQSARVLIRPYGELDPALCLELPSGSNAWQTAAFQCRLPAGYYEALFMASPCVRGHGGRELGVAVASMSFA